VYTYIRFKWNKPPADAEDLTQDFFAQAFEKGFLARYDPAKARFRTFLRVCVDGLVSKANVAERRLKRGGGRVEGVDPSVLERRLAGRAAPDPSDPDGFFHREFVRELFGSAVEELREECSASGKQIQFVLFDRYDLQAEAAERPTYADLAAEHRLPATQVTNYLAAMRRRFRAIVLERLRALTGSEREFREEAAAVFGLAP